VTRRYDAVLSDIRLPDEDGGQAFMSLLGRADAATRLPPFVFITGFGSIDRAVELMKAGAADYVTKPFNLDRLVERMQSLCEYSRQSRSGGGLGISPTMHRIASAMPRLAAQAGTLLITGESGVGKEHVARLFHQYVAESSGEAKTPFVAVNCAALPETLMEAELFGYERGAFTGAAQQKKGKFELASSGTIFLDEIGDMNPVTQSKVLRVLENRTIERLGGTQSIPVDVRVISATHRNLAAEIRNGKFRDDLFYRLRVVTIELPPLRAHKSDIALLTETFLQMHGARLGRAARLKREAMAAIERYDWPGNVRELKNALERSLVLCRGEEIGVEDLPAEVAHGERLSVKHGSEEQDNGMGERDFREAKRKFEVAYLMKQLAEHRWNVSRTAATIGLHRQSLQEKLRELGIRRPGREAVEDEE
jgi:DNA-binding NtrC family response regulator